MDVWKLGMYRILSIVLAMATLKNKWALLSKSLLINSSHPSLKTSKAMRCFQPCVIPVGLSGDTVEDLAARRLRYT